MEGQRVSWVVVKTPTGWQGTVILPLSTGRMLRVNGRSSDAIDQLRTLPKAKAKAKGKRLALGRAANLAAKLMKNPMVAALIPPQAALVLQGIKALASSKKLRKLVSKGGKKAWRFLSRKLRRKRQKKGRR